MRATGKERIFHWILLGGAILFLGTILLPNVPAPQVLTLESHQEQTDNSGYLLHAAFIPPISRGTEIKIAASGYNFSSVLITIYTINNDKFGFPIFSKLLHTPYFSGVLESPETQSYVLVVTSFNHTDYVVTLSSTWSPFYVLRSFAAEALFVVIIGLAGTYYFHERANREKMEELALNTAMHT